MEKFIKNILIWLASTKFMAFPRSIVARTVEKAVSYKNGIIVYYNDPEQVKVFDLIRCIKREVEILLNDHEAYQLIMEVKRTDKISGDLAEVGAYSGGSAKLICEVKGMRSLHVFDTFEGLPELSPVDNPSQFHPGLYTALFEEVKSRLARYPNVYVYKGLFPDTAEPLKNKKFSFVHLDVDLYESTLHCLKFFYPRLSGGAVLISHDYNSTLGVRKAFDDFFQDKPEPIRELLGSQCMIVKS